VNGFKEILIKAIKENQAHITIYALSFPIPSLRGEVSESVAESMQQISRSNE
jgi:hypothetical protein